MLEKLIDTIVLLIAALQENTKAHSAPIVRAESPVAGASPDQSNKQEKPPRAPKPPKADTVATPAPEVAAAPPPKPTAPDFGGTKKPAPLPPMTLDEANTALSAAWETLGGDDMASQKVFNVLAEYGVAGLTQLPDSSKYAEIVAKVRALQ